MLYVRADIDIPDNNNNERMEHTFTTHTPPMAIHQGLYERAK